MVPLTQLWLPIVLSAVVVFVASSVIHMLLGLHFGDYKKLPNEEKLREAIREANVPPGNYMFPCASSPKVMNSPEMIEKWTEGPVGLMNVLPSGPPAMGKNLVQWFAYCLALGFMLAYLAGRTLGPGADYLAVFRVVGTVGFLGYGFAEAVNSIWKGQAWATTFKHMFDGLVYALLTAGVFGWLWPG